MPLNLEAANARPCPRCGAEITPIPIVYGLPTHELFEAAERGEVQLGGCMVGDESPEFQCKACQAALPWSTDAGQRIEGLAYIRFGR